MSWPDDVTKKDLRIECIRGSGKGGQNRNKRDTAVRITHILTGLVGYAEDERSQWQNKKLAFQRLAKQLVPLMKHEAQKARYNNTERVRTYHELDQRVVDARVEGKQWRYDDVIHDDALQEIIEEVSFALSKEKENG